MKAFCCFLLVIFFEMCASGQGKNTVSVTPRPSWIKEFQFGKDFKDTLNTSGGYFNLLYDDQYNAVLKESYHHYAQKILSEKGLENISTLSFVFDPSYETLSFHRIDIIRNGKRINQFLLNKFEILRRETSLEKLVYDGNLTAVFNLHDVQVGDILEYSYSLRGANPVMNNKFSKIFYFNFSVPVGEVICRLVTPAGHPFEIRNINSPPVPEITKSSNQVIYEWVVKNAPAVLSEESSPGWYDPYNHVQASDFGSWHELCVWGDALFEMKNPGLLSKIPEIKKENKDEAIRKIIQFVQDEVRYLSFSEGIHGFKPHAPSKILSQRFGDCKDKSFLLSSLLNELGVSSHPVLVNTVYGKALPDYLPSPSLFNHCIVQFVLRDSVYWVDPTLTFQRGPLKELYFPNYSNGLVISKETTALTSMPFSPEATLSTDENFNLDKIGGSATLTVKSTYSRQEANYMREYFISNSQNEVDKQYLNFYATDYPEIVKSKPVKWTDDETRNIITSEESYEILKFWSYDSLNKKYSVSVYPRNLAAYLVKPKTKIRLEPYSISFPLNVAHRIAVHMPEEWNVLPVSKEIESEGFSYHSKTSYHDQTIDLSFRFQTKRPYLEKEKVKDYISKIDEALNDMNFTISYTAPGDTKEAFNFPFLLILIGVVFASFFGFRYLYSMDPEPKFSTEHYTSIGGWLILPAIGLCFTPIKILYDLETNLYFNYTSWQMMTDPSYATYRPLLGSFVLLELLANALLFMYSIFVVVMLFQRRTSVPIFVIGFYIANVVLQGGDGFVGTQFGVEFDTESVKSLIRGIIGAAIWIPYFLISERSKGTFTVRNGIPPGHQEVYRMKL